MISKKILLAEDDKARNRGGISAARDEERVLKSLARGVHVGRVGRSNVRRFGASRAGQVSPRSRHVTLAEWRGLATYLVEGNKVGEGEREAPGGEGRVGYVAARNIPWHVGDESTPIAANEIEELFSWMADTAAVNSRANKTAILHYSVSLPTEDAKRATAELWSEYLNSALEGLGLEEHQAVIVEHVDTQNPHIHLVVNRIHPTSYRAVDPWWDIAKLEKLNRQFERRYGLKVEPGRLINPETLKPKSRNETRPERRKRGTRIDAEKLTRKIKARVGKVKPFSEAVGWADLEVKLDKLGLHLRASGRGFSLVDVESGCEVKASKIGGKAANRERLEERFAETWTDYHALRDEAQAAGQSVEAARLTRDQQAEAERAAEKAAKRERALQLIKRPAFVGSHAPYLSPLGIESGGGEFDIKEAIAELNDDELKSWADRTREKHAEAKAQKRNGNWYDVEHGTHTALSVLERELADRGIDPQKGSIPQTGEDQPERSNLQPLVIDPEDKTGIATAQVELKKLSKPELEALAEAARAALPAAKQGSAVGDPASAARARGLRQGLRILAAEAKVRGFSVAPPKAKSKNQEIGL